MKRRLKRGLEVIFLDRIWLDRAMPNSVVSALIERLKPAAAPTGLRRIGPDGDGGYLVPDDLEGIEACISPGVASECGFDEEMASRGIDVIMADASIEKPPSRNSRFHFVRKFVDIVTTDQTVTLDDLCRVGDLARSESDLLLQMDVEGAEYRVVANMSDELLKRFRIMVIEFHDLDLIFSRFGFAMIKPVLDKLTTFHRVVHIHPNNHSRVSQRGDLCVPSIMEFTFYRRDRLLPAPSSALAFPHPLDVDCVPHRPSLALPRCWWQ